MRTDEQRQRDRLYFNELTIGAPMSDDNAMQMVEQLFAEMKADNAALVAERDRLRAELARIEASARSFVGYNFDKKMMWPSAFNALMNIANDAREALKAEDDLHD